MGRWSPGQLRELMVPMDHCAGTACVHSLLKPGSSGIFRGESGTGLSSSSRLPQVPFFPAAEIPANISGIQQVGVKEPW